MSTIVTRTGKGSALTVAEMDANLTNLNTDKLELDDISVTTGAGGETSALSYNNTTGVFTFTPNTTADLAALDDFSVTTAAASSGGALAYNNTTGVFTFTPADLSGLSLTGITDNATGSVITIDDNDTTMSTNLVLSSGHNLDLVNGHITSSTSGGNVELLTDAFGQITLNSNNIKVDGAISPIGVNDNLDLSANGTGSLNFNSLAYFDAGIEEAVHTSTTTTGTYAPDPTNGSIHYVAMSGNMTINGFSTAVAGQTITLFFDGTGGAYTLTLGASILSPGGSLALTSGGYDIVTITCIDDVTPVYVATAVNDFQ